MIEIDDAVTSSAVIAEPKSSFTALNWNQRSISIPKGFILGADQGPSQGRDSSDPQQGGFEVFLFPLVLCIHADVLERASTARMRKDAWRSPGIG